MPPTATAMSAAPAVFSPVASPAAPPAASPVAKPPAPTSQAAPPPASPPLFVPQNRAAPQIPSPCDTDQATIRKLRSRFGQVVSESEDKVATLQAKLRRAERLADPHLYDQLQAARKELGTRAEARSGVSVVEFRGLQDALGRRNAEISALQEQLTQQEAGVDARRSESEKETKQQMKQQMKQQKKLEKKLEKELAKAQQQCSELGKAHLEECRLLRQQVTKSGGEDALRATTFQAEAARWRGEAIDAEMKTLEMQVQVLGLREAAEAAETEAAEQAEGVFDGEESRDALKGQLEAMTMVVSQLEGALDKICGDRDAHVARAEVLVLEKDALKRQMKDMKKGMKEGEAAAAAAIVAAAAAMSAAAVVEKSKEKKRKAAKSSRRTRSVEEEEEEVVDEEEVNPVEQMDASDSSENEEDSGDTDEEEVKEVAVEVPKKRGRAAAKPSRKDVKKKGKKEKAQVDEAPAQKGEEEEKEVALKAPKVPVHPAVTPVTAEPEFQPCPKCIADCGKEQGHRGRHTHVIGKKGAKSANAGKKKAEGAVKRKAASVSASGESDMAALESKSEAAKEAEKEARANKQQPAKKAKKATMKKKKKKEARTPKSAAALVPAPQKVAPVTPAPPAAAMFGGEPNVGRGMLSPLECAENHLDMSMANSPGFDDENEDSLNASADLGDSLSPIAKVDEDDAADDAAALEDDETPAPLPTTTRRRSARFTAETITEPLAQSTKKTMARKARTKASVQASKPAKSTAMRRTAAAEEEDLDKVFEEVAKKQNMKQTKKPAKKQATQQLDSTDAARAGGKKRRLFNKKAASRDDLLFSPSPVNKEVRGDRSSVVAGWGVQLCLCYLTYGSVRPLMVL